MSRIQVVSEAKSVDLTPFGFDFMGACIYIINVGYTYLQKNLGPGEPYYLALVDDDGKPHNILNLAHLLEAIMVRLLYYSTLDNEIKFLDDHAQYSPSILNELEILCSESDYQSCKMLIEKEEQAQDLSPQVLKERLVAINASENTEERQVIAMLVSLSILNCIKKENLDNMKDIVPLPICTRRISMSERDLQCQEQDEMPRQVGRAHGFKPLPNGQQNGGHKYAWQDRRDING